MQLGIPERGSAKLGQYATSFAGLGNMSAKCDTETAERGQAHEFGRETLKNRSLQVVPRRCRHDRRSNSAAPKAAPNARSAPHPNPRDEFSTLALPSMTCRPLYTHNRRTNAPPLLRPIEPAPSMNSGPSTLRTSPLQAAQN